MSVIDTKCICGGEAGRTFLAKERQLGMGDEFVYVECATCGSLRIATIPKNLGHYYPAGYYSYERPKDGWLTRIQSLAVRYALLCNRPLLPQLHFHWAYAVQAASIRTKEQVLDVGSGVQGLAVALWRAGHRSAIGIDPFIQEDIRDPNFGTILKRYLSDVVEKQDVIEFNHSLEHVPDPVAELIRAKELLRPNGAARIVVSVPVVAHAYREYGTYWFGLDAPRHLFIPTAEGLEHLARRVGLTIVDAIYNSDYTQFWFSELYQKGIPFVPLGSERYWELITRSERRKLNRRARELNKVQDGDKAIFILKPSASSETES